MFSSQKEDVREAKYPYIIHYKISNICIKTQKYTLQIHILMSTDEIQKESLQKF